MKSCPPTASRALAAAHLTRVHLALQEAGAHHVAGDRSAVNARFVAGLGVDDLHHSLLKIWGQLTCPQMRYAMGTRPNGRQATSRGTVDLTGVTTLKFTFSSILQNYMNTA